MQIVTNGQQIVTGCPVRKKQKYHFCIWQPYRNRGQTEPQTKKHKTATRMTPSNPISTQNALISEKYIGMKPVLLSFIRKHTGCCNEAEDILQEAFTRLLEYKTVLTAATLERFIYRICRNLIVDWYRRHALSAKAQEFFSLCRNEISDSTENTVSLNEMLRIEGNCIRKMGRRKGEIYLLYIHKGKTSGEISTMLKLSKRTVENHIFAARNIIRTEFRKAL